MNRRTLLAGLGVGAAELCVLSRSLPVVSAGSIFASPSTGTAWLKRFHNKSTADLIRSRRFRALLQNQFPGVLAPFQGDQSLWAATWNYLSRPSDTPVTVHQRRFLVAHGSMAHCGSCRGMVWVDTSPRRSSPLIVLVFLHGPFHELWITSNQSLAPLAPPNLPIHLRKSIHQWLRERRPLQGDGGLLERVVVYDTTPEDVSPALKLWGVPHRRCTPTVLRQSISNGLAI